MKISYAYETGSSHIAQGRPCEDSVCIGRDNGIYVAALSDGAGSKPLAMECSRLLSESTVSYFLENTSQIECFCKDDFLSFITEKLTEEGMNAENAGGTLIFFAANDTDFVCGHIGDGVVLLRELNDEFIVFSRPENGQYLNQTFFIPGKDIHEHFFFYNGISSNVDCVIITSDGISDMLYEFEDYSPAPACSKLALMADSMNEEEMNTALKDAISNVFSLYTGDDISIIVIKR